MKIMLQYVRKAITPIGHGKLFYYQFSIRFL